MDHNQGGNVASVEIDLKPHKEAGKWLICDPQMQAKASFHLPLLGSGTRTPIIIDWHASTLISQEGRLPIVIRTVMLAKLASHGHGG